MTSTDHNLLFGLLALEAGFIDEHRFLEAAKIWAHRKDVELAQICIERDWLSANTCKEIERRLVEQSSISTSTGEQARRALAVLNDSELDRTISKLSHPDGREIDPPSIQSSQRDRFTLTSLFAKGGIGQVWRARDPRLGREVALKELRDDRQIGADFRRRFLNEARITSQLGHPSIVPIYELSTPADRQPFYTMRMIEGETLVDVTRRYHACRIAGTANPLAFRELLGVFVKVCQAIAFAHSRGVLHRDLKGQNVVIGNFGEVIVLDWGLAKFVREQDATAPAIDADDEDIRSATLAGQVMGTPGYMAPEQAAGRIESIDVRTDVYGLGAILYEILTGTPPFTGNDKQEILRKVREDQPRKPRSIVLGLSPSLEAICLKAITKDPTQRYARASELTSDIERWLADESVSVLRDPLTVRAWRWARRHRTLVSGVAAGLVVTLIAGSVALALTTASERQAQKARERAEASLRISVDTNVTVGEIGDELAEVATTNRATVAKILRKAEEGYTRLIEQSPNSPEIEFARARMLVGFARLELSLSGTRRGEERANDARRLFEGLEGRSPDELERRIGLARSLYWLAVAKYRSGRSTEAIADYDQCLAIRRELVAERPDGADRQAELAGVLVDIGDISFSRGEPKRMESANNEAFSIREKLWKENPNVPTRQRDYAQSLVDRALAALGAREADKADADVKLALELLDSSDRVEPFHAKSWSARVVAHTIRADRMRSKDEAATQLELEKALSLVTRFREFDPQNSKWMDWELRLQFNLSNLTSAKAGQFLVVTQKLGAECQRLIERDPDDSRPKLLRALALQLEASGASDLAAEQEEPSVNRAFAVDRLKKSTTLAAELHALDPVRLDFRLQLNVSRRLLAQALREVGDDDAAYAAETERAALGIGWAEDKLLREPESAATKRELAWWLAEMAFAQVQHQQHAEALPLLDRAVALRRSAGDATSKNAATVDRLAQVLDLRANARGALKDRDGELNDHREALQLRQTAMALQPQEFQWRVGAADTIEQLSSAMFRAGQTGWHELFLSTLADRARISTMVVNLIAQSKKTALTPAISGIRSLFQARNREGAEHILELKFKRWSYDADPHDFLSLLSGGCALTRIQQRSDGCRINMVRIAESYIHLAKLVDAGKPRDMVAVRGYLGSALAMYNQLPTDQSSQQAVEELNKAIIAAISRTRTIVSK